MGFICCTNVNYDPEETIKDKKAIKMKTKTYEHYLEGASKVALADDEGR